MGGRPESVAAARAAQPVRFTVEVPASSRVTVVGDFNDWDPKASPMVPGGPPGTWSLRLALPPGRYRYSFLVDGTRWVQDPSEPVALGNDFDIPTSVITVTGGAL
jgi:1,4-alpha-glucan branching enzyme